MLSKFLFFGFGIIFLAARQPVFAHTLKPNKWGAKTENAKMTPKADDDISTELIAEDKNAIFDSRARFTFIVKNNSNATQTGKVSYQVTTETGKVLNSASVNVTIAKKSSGSYPFEIAEAAAGFYKVNFMVNVTDYDDTTRRAFGIRPEEIKSNYAKPADFDTFWQTAKSDLDKVSPDFRVTEMIEQSTKKRSVYLIEMQSLGNVTVRGWMTIPKMKDRNQKFAVVLDLPGYQVDLPPLFGDDNDVAYITLNVRGQGNSRDVIDLPTEEAIVNHIEDKNKYLMRGIIMDCVRCIDFIYSRPELNHKQIFVKGGSMGAYLAIATASLDKRVDLCSAQSPILCDIRTLVNEVNFPVVNIKRYIQTQPGLTMDKVLDNLDYYDVKNFALNVTCPSLMSIGLLDNYAPPNNDYIVYNNLAGKKRISIFKDLGHDVSQQYINLEVAWMHDQFALF